jgi:hypothetical protein
LSGLGVLRTNILTSTPICAYRFVGGLSKPFQMFRVQAIRRKYSKPHTAMSVSPLSVVLNGVLCTGLTHGKSTSRAEKSHSGLHDSALCQVWLVIASTAAASTSTKNQIQASASWSFRMQPFPSAVVFRSQNLFDRCLGFQVVL